MSEEPVVLAAHDHASVEICTPSCSAWTVVQADKALAEQQQALNRINAERVNHPSHYNSHPSGIECIEIVRHFNFNIGNVFKYLWRSAYKGATLEDHKKALWYLQDEIARLEKEANVP